MRVWNFGRTKGGKNKVQYRHLCEWCGAGFSSARPDAMTCGSVCRTNWSRWGKKYRELYGTRPTAGPRGDVDRQKQWPDKRKK